MRDFSLLVELQKDMKIRDKIQLLKKYKGTIPSEANLKRLPNKLTILPIRLRRQKSRGQKDKYLVLLRTIQHVFPTAVEEQSNSTASNSRN